MKTAFGTALSLCVAGMLGACSSPETATDSDPSPSGAVEAVAASAPETTPSDFPEPLAAEEMGITHTLSTPYPDSIAVIHDSAFFNMIDGKFVVFDIAASSGGIKGSFHGGMIGSFDAAPDRNEMYVATTYYSRGVGGERTDIIAIHDMESLEKTGEIIIPSKIISSMPWKNRFRLTNDKSQGLVMNFTPGASVSVIDMAGRKMLNEVDIPGCSLIFPMGDRGFATVCGDGGMLGVTLDDQGNVVEQTRLEPFIDHENDAMFLKNGRIGDMTYFPTFTGNIQPIDLSGPAPVLGESWSLLSAADKAGNWRPGGMHLIADDNDHSLFVLMHPDGGEGTHKNGGSEIWVYDVNTRERTRKISLNSWGITIGYVGGRLLVTNGDLGIEVYNAETGDFERDIGGAAQTPFTFYAADGQ